MNLGDIVAKGARVNAALPLGAVLDPSGYRIGNE